VRHLIGTGLAVVMALTMFFGGAWGYLRLLSLPAPLTALPAGGGSLLSSYGVLAALGAVAGTCILAGILIAVPVISPLAAGLPGLLLIAWTGLYLASVRHAVDLIPLRRYSFGTGWESLLINGVLGGAGLAMIVPMFVPSRWRRDEVPIEDEMNEARELIEGLTGSTAPATQTITPSAIWPKGTDTLNTRPSS
jgi:hypothetical protein